MRKSAADKMRSQIVRPPEMLNGIEDLIKLMVSKNADPNKRVILPTQRDFILGHSPLEAYMGPAGCAKTTTGAAKVLLRALLIPGSKWFVARRDYNDLADTTARSMAEIMSRLPEGTLVDRVKQPPMRWLLRPVATGRDDMNGALSEITFMGLSDQIRSYEFTGGFIDEADEVERQYFDEMKMRLRFWPPGMGHVPDSLRHSIWMAFNPPPTSHWLYEECTGLNEAGEVKKQPSIRLYRPQPRENVANLPKSYYDDMGATLTADLRKRLVDGDWGSTFPGQPVIRQFQRAMHVRRKLKYMGGTLYRFWDFGYRIPVCLFAQVSRHGRVEVLAELRGQNVEIGKFVETALAFTAEKFPEAVAFEDYGDPAVKQHKDTGSALAVLHNAGINLKVMRTPMDMSLNTLRKRFETLIEGAPAITIDESCRVLCDGLAGGYHLKDDGVTPHKDNVYDHSVDALRYGIWFIFGATASAQSSTMPISLAYTDSGEAVNYVNR